MLKLTIFNFRSVECLIFSLIAGIVSMILLHYAGIRGNFIAFGATLPSLPIVYFLLVQPALDEVNRKRGEPLFRLRCKLLGHKYTMSPQPPHMVWCDRCGETKGVWP